MTNLTKQITVTCYEQPGRKRWNAVRGVSNGAGGYGGEFKTLSAALQHVGQ